MNKYIHLYDIHSPMQAYEYTGRYLTPPQLLKVKIPKEDFSGTEKYLEGYTGKWFIEARREHKNSDEFSPFDLEIGYVGPGGYWFRPVSVYLVLEE